MTDRSNKSDGVVTRPMVAVLLAAVVAGAACDDPSRVTLPVEPDLAKTQRVGERGAVRQSPRVLASPVRLTLGRGRTLFVADYLARKVVQFRIIRGRLRLGRSFAVDGLPLGIAAARNLLFVGNAAAQSVEVYRTNGMRLDDLAAPGTVSDPKDIAVDSEQGLVFVLDGHASRIWVFSIDRVLQGSIGAPGTGPERLQNPTGLAVDPVRREVVVSDYGDPRTGDHPAIKIFGYDGAFVEAISGKSGMFGKRFSRPQGLTVGAAGHIFITEALAGQIIVLERESRAVVKTLGALGAGPGDLWLPLDVVVDRNRDVFVVNNRLGRIEVYGRGGKIQ